MFDDYGIGSKAILGFPPIYVNRKPCDSLPFRNGAKVMQAVVKRPKWAAHSYRCEHDESNCCESCYDLWHKVHTPIKPILAKDNVSVTYCHTDTQQPNTLREYVAASAVSTESAESTVCHDGAPLYLRVALARVKAKAMPTIADDYCLPNMQLLVSLCAELQRLAKGGTFFLSCRDAGELIGESFRSASRWLKKLELDGVLHRVSTGSKGKRKANEYRFKG